VAIKGKHGMGLFSCSHPFGPTVTLTMRRCGLAASFNSMKRTPIKSISKSAQSKMERKLDTLWKEAVKVVYGRKCLVCGKKRPDVHHVRGKEAFPAWRWTVENGLPLCRTHHIWVGDNPAEAEAYIREHFADQGQMYDRRYKPMLRTMPQLHSIEEQLMKIINGKEER
jgi:hypothetical protein